MTDHYLIKGVNEMGVSRMNVEKIVRKAEKQREQELKNWKKKGFESKEEYRTFLDNQDRQNANNPQPNITSKQQKEIEKNAKNWKKMGWQSKEAYEEYLTTKAEVASAIMAQRKFLVNAERRMYLFEKFGVTDPKLSKKAEPKVKGRGKAIATLGVGALAGAGAVKNLITPNQNAVLNSNQIDPKFYQQFLESEEYLAELQQLQDNIDASVADLDTLKEEQVASLREQIEQITSSAENYAEIKEAQDTISYYQSIVDNYDAQYDQMIQEEAHHLSDYFQEVGWVGTREEFSAFAQSSRDNYWTYWEDYQEAARMDDQIIYNLTNEKYDLHNYRNADAGVSNAERALERALSGMEEQDKEQIALLQDQIDTVIQNTKLDQAEILNSLDESVREMTVEMLREAGQNISAGDDVDLMGIITYNLTSPVNLALITVAATALTAGAYMLHKRKKQKQQLRKELAQQREEFSRRERELQKEESEIQKIDEVKEEEKEDLNEEQPTPTQDFNL